MRTASLLIAALAITPVLSVRAHAAVGDACDAATFTQACDADDPTKLDTCSVDTVQLLDCTTEAHGAACGTAPSCSGSGCAALPTETCVAQEGGACDGLALLLDTDQSNDALVGVVLCAVDDTCATNTLSDGTVRDACVPHEGAACIVGDVSNNASCNGNVLTICLGDDTKAVASNLAVDCSVFGSTCGEQLCSCDQECGDGNTCVNGVCSFGVTCAGPSEGDGGCGIVVVGEGEGTAECFADSDCGRDLFCANGSCVPTAVGEGEGEGEGGAACAVDADCTGGTVCDVDGRCKLPIHDDVTPAPRCSHTSTRGSAPWGAAGVVVVAALWRRRRAPA